MAYHDCPRNIRPAKRKISASSGSHIHESGEMRGSCSSEGVSVTLAKNTFSNRILIALSQKGVFNLH